MIHNEATFEEAIVTSLIERDFYILGHSDEYRTDIGLFAVDVIGFLKETQPTQWAKLISVHGENNTEKRILERLVKEIDFRGVLDVIRNGFSEYGIKFALAYFKPETGFNLDSQQLYQLNRLKVYRQVYYSSKNKNSVDVVLALNGFPVVTLELKNQFTGQSVDNAKKQYAQTRDNTELLFAFKKRSLVHFAVDTDEVYMTTKIEKNIFWLPFNKGNNKGKGNPVNNYGYRTSYLWEKILTKDSLMEVIQRFMHLQVEKKTIEGKVFTKETLIFPRYHQLDVVRKLAEDVKQVGSGKNYLIQHSAGSGKSNSIAWLSYRLSSLHNTQNERIFDSVIVVTDRRVLDSQLQNTIYQFEHKSGVVQKIDENSSQLAEAIMNGTHIIITTLQKFPYVIDKVQGNLNKRFAVIIDEAHSSQGGEASKKMREVLGTSTLDDEEEDENLNVKKSALARGKQANISFFAFTATPKYRTLAVFGHHDENGKPTPFHLYSMRQAIEENFILDVLKNYTTYSLFFKLSKAIEDNPEINKKKAAKAIGRFVSLHPHNLAQKTEIIVEHFRQVVAHKIGGKAKAMLVCSSRLHAKRYFEQFNKYIKAKGYDNELKVLVAFSGAVKDDNYPDGVTEPQLTGFPEKELPSKFEKEEYKILIVAEKYQTGFDQPLLHTMYVDKALSGVKAVQTLSRLNRMARGKEDTFVLDFVNDEQTILDSFQPYYEQTTVKEEPNINHLWDLKHKLDSQQVYWQSDIDGFCAVYFRSSNQLTAKDQSTLNSFIDSAVERYKKLPNEDTQEDFKKDLRTWTNLYSFMSQIMPFQDVELEKFFAYGKFLLTKLPKNGIIEAFHLVNEVALEYYRLTKIKEGNIELEKNKDGELDGVSGEGLTRGKDEKVKLSEIIDVLNQRFGTEFEEADRYFFDQLEAELMADDKLKAQATANKIDNFKYGFEEIFFAKLIERMEQNKDIFEKIIDDQAFGSIVKEYMMQRVHARFNE